MSSHWKTLALLALLVMFSARSAQAFFDLPWITPTTPTAGQIVSINIHGGECDTIFGEDGYPQITQAGSDIRIVWYGQHWPEGSGDLLCSFGIGTLTYPIGTFSPGSHTVTVDLAYRDFFGMPSILTIGVVSFTITGATSAVTPVPTSSPVGLFPNASAWTDRLVLAHSNRQALVKRPMLSIRIRRSRSLRPRG